MVDGVPGAGGVAVQFRAPTLDITKARGVPPQVAVFTVSVVSQSAGLDTDGVVPPAQAGAVGSATEHSAVFRLLRSAQAVASAVSPVARGQFTELPNAITHR